MVVLAHGLRGFEQGSGPGQVAGRGLRFARPVLLPRPDVSAVFRRRLADRLPSQRLLVTHVARGIDLPEHARDDELLQIHG